MSVHNNMFYDTIFVYLTGQVRTNPIRLRILRFVEMVFCLPGQNVLFAPFVARLSTTPFHLTRSEAQLFWHYLCTQPMDQNQYNAHGILIYKELFQPLPHSSTVLGKPVVCL